MKGNISHFMKHIASRIKRFFAFVFPKKSPKENIFQYSIRQFYVADARGNPSLTVTILMFVMTIVAAVTFIECRMALMPTYVYDAAGKIIESHPTGFSATFLTLVISMSAILTYFYRQRQNKIGSDEQGEVYHKSMIAQVRNYVDTVLGSNDDSSTPEGK